MSLARLVQNAEEMNLLYRRVFDGDPAMSMDADVAFVAACMPLAISRFAEVVRSFDPRGLNQELQVFFGRKQKVFEEEIDQIPPPPYYLWCRCTLWISAPLVSGDTTSMRRRASGLIEPVIIL